MKFKRFDRFSSTVPFEGIISQILTSYELEKSFTIQELSIQWKNIVGDIISTHSQPLQVNNHTLVIGVDHPIFANEIQLLQDSILKNINEDYSLLTVKRIKVVVTKLIW